MASLTAPGLVVEDATATGCHWSCKRARWGIGHGTNPPQNEGSCRFKWEAEGMHPRPLEDGICTDVSVWRDPDLGFRFLHADVHLYPIWYEYFSSVFLASISLSRLCVLPLGRRPKSQMCKKGEKKQGMEKLALKFINKCLTSPRRCLFP